MNKKLRDRLIVFFTFIGGLYFFLEFLLPEEMVFSPGQPGFKFGKFHSEILNGVVLVRTMAIGLGIINLLQVHGRNIIRGRKQWGNSLALLLGLFTSLGIEFFDLVQSEIKSQELKVISDLITYSRKIEEDSKSEKTPDVKQVVLMSGVLTQLQKQSKTDRSFLNTSIPNFKDNELGTTLANKFQAAKESAIQFEQLSTSGLATKDALSNFIQSLKDLFAVASEVSNKRYELTTTKKLSRFLFRGFLAPLGAAMFSLLAFYIATAAYRTFRVKSAEAFLMMAAALVVIVGQIPQGPLYISARLPEVRLWLIENISTPAFRAIYFGAAIAGIAMAFRMWFSLEKSPLTSHESSEKTGE